MTIIERAREALAALTTTERLLVLTLVRHDRAALLSELVTNAAVVRGSSQPSARDRANAISEMLKTLEEELLEVCEIAVGIV